MAIRIRSWPILLQGNWFDGLSFNNINYKYNIIYGCSRLGVKSGGASVYHKTNRETMVEIGDSIRGKDIYIIQTGTK